MQPRWRAQWRWAVGGLAMIALAMLTGCGNSGSASRGADGITGATSPAEDVRSVDAAKKKQATPKANDDAGDNGEHRGRPEAEVQGLVSGVTGSCPTLDFTVAGTPVRVNGVTQYEGLSCADIASHAVTAVKVEGQPLGNGTILAREVKAAVAPPPVVGLNGIVVTLEHGTDVVAGVTTHDGGKFEFRNSPPGVYDLKATLGSTQCTLATDVGLVAQKNRVKGQLFGPASPSTCADLIVQRLEVRQGNRG